MTINKIDSPVSGVNATKPLKEINKTNQIGNNSEISNTKPKDSIEFSEEFNKIQNAINSINNQDIRIDSAKIAQVLADINAKELGLLSNNPSIKLSTANRIASKILEDF